jgi:hypothetical protein
MSTRNLVAVVFLSLATLSPLHAEEGKKQFSEKQLAQQQRMKDCSAEAKEKGLKAEDRKAWMKTCLSAGKVDAAPAASEPAKP